MLRNTPFPFLDENKDFGSPYSDTDEKVCLEYYGLSEPPFNNTPDPRFLYPSKQHAEAMLRMKYVVQRRKAAGMLTGVFGCGKTLLGQSLLYSLDVKRYKFVYINNPTGTSRDLLRLILIGFGKQSLPPTKSEMLFSIERILIDNIRDNKYSVVVIDEAHAIDNESVFDEIRLLLNFQVEDAFLLTLLLLGQPELKDKVENNKPLLQRISMRYHLGPLDLQDTANYVLHRKKVANSKKPLFSKEAILSIYKYTGGIPRRINELCDLALFLAYSKRQPMINRSFVEQAAEMLAF